MTVSFFLKGVRFVFALMCGMTIAIGFAQTWPDKTVKIINPYSPGGPSDAIVRMLAEGLSSEMGQRFMVENKPGGGTCLLYTSPSPRD